MGLIKCVSLIEERAFSFGLERMISLGLDRAFSLGLERVLSGLEVQDVNVRLALAASLNGQITVGL